MGNVSLRQVGGHTLQHHFETATSSSPCDQVGRLQQDQDSIQESSQEIPFRVDVPEDENLQPEN